MKAGLKLAFRGPLLAQVFSVEIKALEVEQLLHDKTRTVDDWSGVESNAIEHVEDRDI